ncbi:hypothetical protein TNCV_1664241 [Trichonephila clavipes]|uniref:Uncharacterized protein n=1 Tax=Trichonephila clavipes TaxID=2585209 RepID=A0A8X6RX22_TRICX|nr:hypothetical protein TNCV_1664241 [Trichonephila clavipes]
MWTRNYGALGQMARVCFGVLCANRTREVKRDFGDLPIRRSEGRVVNTPLVFKRGFFGGKKKRKSRKKEKRFRERERTEGGGETKKEKEEERERENGKRTRRKKDKRVREREWTEGGGETEKRERRRKESRGERVKPALNGEKG